VRCECQFVPAGTVEHGDPSTRRHLTRSHPTILACGRSERRASDSRSRLSRTAHRATSSETSFRARRPSAEATRRPHQAEACVISTPTVPGETLPAPRAERRTPNRSQD
jgi:hypothetical protein